MATLAIAQSGNIQVRGMIEASEGTIDGCMDQGAPPYVEAFLTFESYRRCLQKRFRLGVALPALMSQIRAT